MPQPAHDPQPLLTVPILHANLLVVVDHKAGRHQWAATAVSLTATERQDLEAHLTCLDDLLDAALRSALIPTAQAAAPMPVP